MAKPRRPAAVGQAANRKAWVRACALQMPRPQKRHTPSAVAPHTQQCTLRRKRRGGEKIPEQVAGVDEVHADFAGGLGEWRVAAEMTDGQLPGGGAIGHGETAQGFDQDHRVGLVEPGGD
jgi:hypothetical protein